MTFWDFAHHHIGTLWVAGALLFVILMFALMTADNMWTNWCNRRRR